jgi:RES domain-containing protein
LNQLAAIARRLAKTPRIAVRALLVRRVPLEALTNIIPPNFLFTSKRANRYNPAGVECLYFSEDEDTAKLEYERFWAGLLGDKQPFVTYFARVRLHNVLDLTIDSNLSRLKLKPQDLHEDWRKAIKPTKTQLLGLAIATWTRISGIRYPSDAASAASSAGTNLVLFRATIQKPDYVKILGPKKQPLQCWP